MSHEPTCIVLFDTYSMVKTMPILQMSKLVFGDSKYLAQSFQIPFSFPNISLGLPDRVLFLLLLTVAFSCILFSFYKLILVCLFYMELRPMLEAFDLD